jgi:tetratricopeptide (TPR) repeat protein
MHLFYKRNYGCLLGMIGCYLLAFSALSWGRVEDTGAPYEMWRDLSRIQLYQSGTGRCPSTEWLKLGLNVEECDSRQLVWTAKAILMDVLAGYGREEIAVKGRIPLDINPRCILGFNLMERFPGTKLGDWGSRQFDQCIEQACLVTMPTTGSTWRTRLSTKLLATDKIEQGFLPVGAFDASEAPYLYHFLVNNSSSKNAQNKAREHLARCLLQDCGLEPGLRQYFILFDQGCDLEVTWLDVATQLELTGAHSKAKRVYRRILRSTNSGEQARKAFENLARILLLESRHGEARSAWALLSERFPKVECAAPDIKDFLNNFQFNRAQMAERFLDKLSKETNGLQALRLCRFFDALLMPKETFQQWQVVSDQMERGSLAHHFCSIFLSKAMLNAGEIDASEAAVRELTELSNPIVQVQSIAMLAEIARAKGNIAESTRLYSRAVQVNRPTALPPCYKEIVQVQSIDTGTPKLGLQTQMLFLKGYNDLIDGDYAAAVDSLSQVAEDTHSLPNIVQRALPCMMMLAWLRLGDPAEAETWGYQAMEKCGLDNQDHAGFGALSAKIRDVDVAIIRLLAKVRDQTIDASSDLAILQDVMDVYNTTMVLDMFASSTGGAESGLIQIYVRAKKCHIAQILKAEYYFAKRRLTGSVAKKRMSSLDLLLFAAQILGDESFDRIKENLSSMSDRDGVNDRMFRLTIFAQRVRRLDLARSALDAAASEHSSAGNVEILEKIAEMYLAFSNHQKAIDVYKIIIAKSEDPGKIQVIQFKIIDIYAESLKNYDMAIQECQKFIQMVRDGTETSKMEFLMGKLYYLDKDYASAVGQLNGFLKRYPDHPLVEQAMLLAGLSSMAEGSAQEAIVRFTKLIQMYPDGNLAPQSKFLIGYAQVSAQQYEAALETFKQLIEQFPHSQYVGQAQSLIDRLSKVSQ